MQRLDVNLFDATEREDRGGAELVLTCHAMCHVELARGKDGAMKCGLGTVSEKSVDRVVELLEEDIVIGACLESLRYLSEAVI